jgi:hypothetical protein
MSGSALWDTKAVGSMKNGIQWRPELAKVCGDVWGGTPEKPLAIFATKIEHVRRGLPNIF